MTRAPREATLDRWLAWLFPLYALPLAIALALITPPFQNPDEENHLLRAVEIAGGELVGRRFDAQGSGGKVDPAVNEADAELGLIAGNQTARLKPGVLERADRVKWSGQRVDEVFYNTVLWSPVLYLPQAAAVRVGQALDWSVTDTLRLVRIVNAVLCVAIGTAGLLLWPAGRALLFTALCFPMALSMYASAAHDGLMITGSVLALALLTRASKAAILGGSLLHGVIAIGRPAYAPIALLALLRRPASPVRWLGVGVAALCLAVWMPFLIAVRVELAHDGLVVDAGLQLAHLIAHPGVIPVIAFETLRAHLIDYGVMYIGVLGSLDTVLPRPYHYVARAILLLALATEAIGPGSASRRDRVLLLIVLLAASGAIFASQYLSWTAVDALVIDGVQGRYFLPLTPAAALMIAGLARRRPRLRAAALIAIALFPLLTAAVVPGAVIARYTG